jgi:hypothetical protein
MMQTHTPPSSVGHARQSSDGSCRSQLEDYNTSHSGQKHRSWRVRPSDSNISKSSSKHRRLAKDATFNGCSDFITTIPKPPPITKYLSQYVDRAQRKFRPYAKPHGHLPTALELRYVDRVCGKYPGESDMSLADVHAVSCPNFIQCSFFILTRNHASGQRGL